MENESETDNQSVATPGRAHRSRRRRTSVDVPLRYFLLKQGFLVGKARIRPGIGKRRRSPDRGI
jgi:hypothetical protein